MKIFSLLLKTLWFISILIFFLAVFMRKQNKASTTLLSSQNFREPSLRSGSLNMSPPPKALYSTGCSRYFNYFFSLRLEGLELISQVFSPSWTSQDVLRRLFPEALLFCSQLFVVIRKIYCFNTHVCKFCGIWNGCQVTPHTWPVWHPLRHDSKEQRSGWKKAGGVGVFPARCCYAGSQGNEQGYAEQLLYFAKMTVFNDAIIYYTVCFSVTEEPSPSSWPLILSLALSLRISCQVENSSN